MKYFTGIILFIAASGQLNALALNVSIADYGAVGDGKAINTAQIQKAGYDSAVVADIVKKINQNEYKRRQMAPGLKVTSKAFGIGRRIPIAQRFSEN